MGKVTLLQSSLLDELKRILQKDVPKSLHVGVTNIMINNHAANCYVSVKI